ncbi:hypothetical protein AVEN_66039-1 [Araneus ventricosus]|uniref:Uncharacterized protein n=1 Tax=Araneus ventricosus TaxID=182803 RepID=A0A4Y2JYB7_ARAVE|nr:hypothetical protein AVEN_66039-1 [Araneus ventricosus]
MYSYYDSVPLSSAFNRVHMSSLLKLPKCVLKNGLTPHSGRVAERTDFLANSKKSTCKKVNRKYSPRPAKAHGFSLNDSRAIATVLRSGPNGQHSLTAQPLP